jgi:tRNA-splicing ligase RtcB
MSDPANVISLDAINEKVEYMLPINEVESGAIDQINHVASFDCVKKIAVMPDAHRGYFLIIGGVALVIRFISPSLVGYDIGCGMCFIDTGEKTRHLIKRKNEKVKVMKYILDSVPVGFNQHDQGSSYNRFTSASGDEELTKRIEGKAGYQLGTLGGGNHFIEIGENQIGNVCVTIHSGSRNPGHTIAGYYMEHGHFLDENSAIGRAYIHDMKWAITYAEMNRKIIMYKVLKALGFGIKKLSYSWGQIINENHNTAIKTKEGWLHRKGATPAEKDQLGIIPGNMGDGVAITVGLGNEKYLKSASHGAGRKFSSTHAKQTLSMEVFEKKMKGIVSNGVHEKNLHESPGAYKDFEKVLAYQEGVVVNVVDRIKPLINVKG